MLRSTETTSREPALNRGARKVPRVRFHRSIVMFEKPREESAGGKSDRSVVLMHDYSPRGVGFRLSRRLERGSRFVLRLVHPSGKRVPVVYTVRHCRPSSDGQFHVGAELTRALPATSSDLLELPAQCWSHEAEAAKPVVSEPVKTEKPPELFTGEPKGFAQGRTLEGQTKIGWARSVDLRQDGDRLWINIHSPGKDNGWGIFVNSSEFTQALSDVSTGGGNRFLMKAA